MEVEYDIQKAMKDLDNGSKNAVTNAKNLIEKYTNDLIKFKKLLESQGLK